MAPRDTATVVVTRIIDADVAYVRRVGPTNEPEGPRLILLRARVRSDAGSVEPIHEGMTLGVELSVAGDEIERAWVRDDEHAADPQKTALNDSQRVNVDLSDCLSVKLSAAEEVEHLAYLAMLRSSRQR